LTLDQITTYVRDAQLPGWFDDDEGAALYHAALRASRSDTPHIIELGTYCGRSTCYLAAAAHQAGRGQVWTIDRHSPNRPAGWSSQPLVSDPLSVATAALSGAGLLSKVRLVVAEASEAVSELPPQAGLVFIDGYHEYRHILSDLELLGGFVALGGCLALHDWDQPGPPDRPWGVAQAYYDWLLSGSNDFEEGVAPDQRGTAHLKLIWRTR